MSGKVYGWLGSSSAFSIFKAGDLLYVRFIQYSSSFLKNLVFHRSIRDKWQFVEFDSENQACRFQVPQRVE